MICCAAVLIGCKSEIKPEEVSTVASAIEVVPSSVVSESVVPSASASAVSASASPAVSAVPATLTTSKK